MAYCLRSIVHARTDRVVKRLIGFAAQRVGEVAGIEVSKGTLWLFVVLFLSSSSSRTQTFPAAAAPSTAQVTELDQGREVVAGLTGNPSQDHVRFRQLGPERAAALLTSVVQQGQGSAATPDDWVAMHRALNGLIELCTSQQQLFKASIYANLQDFAFRRNEGDYRAALSAARQALDLQQRSGETATLSIPWKNIAEDLILLGRIDEGKTALYQAHSLMQDATSPLAADVWSKIVSVESMRGNTVVAHREADSFLQTSHRSAPAIFKGRAFLAAANLAIDDHHYPQAVGRVREALDAVKAAPEATTFTFEAADTLLLLGMEAMQTMPYEDALLLCKQLDTDFPDLPFPIAGFARQVAKHRRRLAGQFDLLLREDSADLLQARAMGDVPGEVSSLMATAVDYAYVNQASQQIVALEQASELIHSSSSSSISPFLRFRLLNTLGAAYLQQKDLRHAGAAFAEVSASIQGTAEARARSHVARLYAEAELGKAAVAELDDDLDGARDLLKHALDPPHDSLGKFTRSVVLLQMARLERSANEHPAEAVRLYIEAIAALHQENDVRTEVYARLQLVRYLAVEAKELTASDLTAREQLVLASTAASSVVLADSTWRIHFLEGILHQNGGNRIAAIRSYVAAVNDLDRIRAGLSQQEQRQSFVDTDSVQELYRRLIQLLTAAGYRQKAWEYLERNKARSFLEVLRGRHFAKSPALTTRATARTRIDLDQLEQQILSARLSLSPENETTLRDSGRSPEVVQAKLTSLEERFALVRQQQSLVGSRATQPLSLRPISLASTQALLPGRTALIEYAILENELAAFVVTRKSATELHWPAKTSEIPSLIRQIRGLLSAPTASAELAPLLASASTLLLNAIFHAIPPGTNHLVIVPTQSLFYIPFEVLPLPNGAGSLIDRFVVSYLPSASVLQFLTFGRSNSSSDLFIGALGNISVDGWPPLPGTVAETAAISALYPHAQRLTGMDFTHAAAIKALTTHQQVHFATHGLLDEQAPLFSALLTAGVKGQPSRLSLYEVMDLNLRARLVILSACETDRGHMTGGDEISGLTRTFLQAGAEDVVSSLWKVSDESTALLMEALHRHLRSGESTPIALRHAELAVRRKFPQPFFWAAFVNTGVR